MSSELVENKNSTSISIKDENSFIFSITKNIKFKVKEPLNAICISDGYLICFGGNYNKGNDFYIRSGGQGGMNKKDSYGDNKYEITNGQNEFIASEFKVYELIF